MIAPSTPYLSSLIACWRYLVIGLLFLLTRSAVAEQPLTTMRSNADRQLRGALTALAQRCDELKLPAQATHTRAWPITRRSDQQVVFFPSARDPLKPSAQSPQLESFWFDQFMRHRKEFAQQLFALVPELLKTGRAPEAYHLLYEVLHADPAHVKAARALDISLERVRPPRAVAGRARQGQLGWAPRSYWTVRTPHYEITTNRSAAAGIALGNQLESLYTAWRQVFFRYWGKPGHLQARMDGNAVTRPRRKLYRVVLFGDRSQYVQYLSRRVAQIGITTGYYDPDEKVAYFYDSDPAQVATWFHEATHQLFQEHGAALDQVGQQHNFWALEGIALYMESLQRFQRHGTLGGFESRRLQYARYHKYINESYLPLEKLVGYGRAELQGHPEIRRLYSQFAGLTHFFMTGQGGQYRTPFQDYLREIYRGSDQDSTLAVRLEQNTKTLDQQYHDFLMVKDQHLAALDKHVQLRKLVLGRTEVTNKGFVQLGKQAHVEWLDLTATRIDAKGMVQLDKWVSLEQLSLEGTRITDQLVARLARLPNLVELDLSGTPITDQALKQLGQLTQLKILWLTGTQVTDAGLPYLETLQQLEMLNLDQTQVSKAAREQLENKLPKLQRSP